MRLLSLELNNFQGVKYASYDFQSKNVAFFGDNATGKTTVFNAVTWLIFGKPSTGEKNYTPKTTDDAGGYLHNLNHMAEARFQLDDGQIVLLKKDFHEIYKKKKGSVDKEFSGHTTEYYLDGVPVGEKQYEDTILKYCGGDIGRMKILTMPDYFAEVMSWSERRQILLEVCGDVSDEDVMYSTPELRDLPAILIVPGTTSQKYSVESYQKIANAKKAKINDELKNIPARIDEAQKAMPDISTLNSDEMEAGIIALEKQKDKLMEERAHILSGDTAKSEIRRQNADAKAKMSEARVEYLKVTGKINEDTLNKISQLQNLRMEANYKVRDSIAVIKDAEFMLQRLNNRRQELLNEYANIQQERWDEGAAICPTCNRPLPAEQVENLQADFNLRRSNRLEEINLRGQKEASKETIDAKNKEVTDAQATVASYESQLTEYDKQIAELQANVKSVEPFEKTAVYAAISAQISAYEANDANEGKRLSMALEAHADKIQAVQEQIRRLREQFSRFDIVDVQQKRIVELESQEKALSVEYERLERAVSLCELFIKQKVKLLTERINAKFQRVRFRLFVEQQNGGVKEDCEVMVPTKEGRLVPFSSANNAARINAGLEIIDTLSKYWQLGMPVFVDNAESVTKLADIDVQVVRLVVSEADKTLRMEVA